jgi:Ca2+-transporting ATPase
MPLTFLTFDPPSTTTMTSPPRDVREHILNRGTSGEVAFLGMLIGGLAFLNFALFMQRNGVVFTVDHAEPFLYARATAVTWLTIAFCQFANILSRRYEYTTIFNGNFWSNRILLYSIAGSIGLISLGIYGPYVHEFLSFAGLAPIDWAHAAGAGLTFLAVFEILKALKRVRRGDSP